MYYMRSASTSSQMHLRTVFWLVLYAVFAPFVTSERPCSFGRFRGDSDGKCVSCPQNKVFDHATYLNTSATHCICRGGFEKHQDTDTCTKCPPGKHAYTPNVCSECETGKFASFSGQTACTDCQELQQCTSTGCTQCSSTKNQSNPNCDVLQKHVDGTDDFSLYKSFSIRKY